MQNSIINARLVAIKHTTPPPNQRIDFRFSRSQIPVLDKPSYFMRPTDKKMSVIASGSRSIDALIKMTKSHSFVCVGKLKVQLWPYLTVGTFNMEQSGSRLNVVQILHKLYCKGRNDIFPRKWHICYPESE